MPVVAWPTGLYPSEVAWTDIHLVASAGRNSLGAEQVVEAPGGRWEAQMTFRLRRTTPGAADDRWAKWQAFTAEMRGGSGVVALPRFVPSGREAATATLTALAARGATSVAVTWSGTAPYAGMDLGLGQRVHRVVSLTGAGPGYTLTVWPPLREQRASGSAVELAAPVCLMRFALDRIPRPTFRQGAEEIEVGFVEHFDALAA